jgi:hypothetical protein
VEIAVCFLVGSVALWLVRLSSEDPHTPQSTARVHVKRRRVYFKT